MTGNEIILRLRNVKKTYENHHGSTITALDGISFDIVRGSLTSIVGPSGCGKTTLLKVIDGLIAPTSGSIELLNRIGKVDKSIRFVFQEYNRSLFPWLNVFKNVSFGLEGIHTNKENIYSKVTKYLEMVKLTEFATSYPWQLSGGMQQRVAIARALACEPEILIMDEPFGSLDALSRKALEDDLLTLWERIKLTIIFVTHDIDEAIYLAQKVIVMSKRPAIIKTCVDISLGFPRNQIATKNDVKFGNYRLIINNLLEDQSDD